MIRLLGVLIVLFASVNALYPSSSDVVDLTASNFDRLVVQSDNIWIVEFFAPWCGHCQQLVPEYSKAATALKGVVKVGAINCDEHKSLAGQYGVKGFPSVKIFGADKNKPEDYTGQRTAQAIVDSALSTVRNKVNSQLGGKKSYSSGGGSSGSKTDSNDVIELTDSNFDSLVLDSNDLWLVEFYAPWCGHCKKLAPEWASAASSLRGKVKLGALDATVHTSKAGQYNIQGYPTIKWFAPHSSDHRSAEDYNGGRTASDIVDWALDKLSENIAAPEIREVTEESVFKSACDESPLCVISVLPHILDCQSDCRQSYIDILNKSGEKYKKKMWGWVWAEAGSQPDLESKLEIGGFGYPAMAVLNAKKLKYSILKGPFSLDGVNEFLRDLSFGRGRTADLRDSKLPKIVTTTPWDGKDGALPEEEDIDLSDVVLDDIKDEL